MSLTIGVDVGGTFTDIYCLNADSGEVHLHKTLSTPANPALAILRGLEELRESTRIALEDIRQLSHGTTVATNALIQRRGKEVTLITTEGFRDLLEIGRQVRPHMFSLKEDHPAPLATREGRWEVSERMMSDGTPRIRLTEDEIERIIDRLRTEKPDSVAIAFLFSFLNPAHEAALAKRIREEFPDILLSVSSEVQPEFREYERTSTTVLNGYLLPVMNTYIGTLQDGFAAKLPNARVGINQSSGGLMSLEQTQRFPIRTGLSGPAAGVVGAIYVGRQSDRPNLITLDMGGTSADVCLIREHKAGITYSGQIAGFPIRVPAIDVHTIGAGGGSIAWLDVDGLMKVGPISAGADPGPACYGRGGKRPTVSDANLVLGRLPGGGLLGGRMQLDRDAARAVMAPIAEQLGCSIERCAAGIIRIVVANMVSAVRVISIERGHDARDFTLIAMGGAGALHSCEVARALGMREVLVPASPGILCAQGLLVADQREEFIVSERFRLTEHTLPRLQGIVRQLGERAARWYEAEAVAPGRRRAMLTIDMRYIGQNFEIPVTLPIEPANPSLPDAAAIARRFFEEHESLYGFHNPAGAIEVINTRFAALGRNPAADIVAPASATSGTPAPVAHAPVVFDHDTAVPAAIYDRARLKPGDRFQGPAVITQLDATTVVFPGDRVRVDDAGNILIEIVS